MHTLTPKLRGEITIIAQITFQSKVSQECIVHRNSGAAGVRILLVSIWTQKLRLSYSPPHANLAQEKAVLLRSADTSKISGKATTTAPIPGPSGTCGTNRAQRTQDSQSIREQGTSSFYLRPGATALHTQIQPRESWYPRIGDRPKSQAYRLRGGISYSQR